MNGGAGNKNLPAAYALHVVTLSATVEEKLRWQQACILFYKQGQWLQNVGEDLARERFFQSTAVGILIPSKGLKTKFSVP